MQMGMLNFKKPALNLFWKLGLPIRTRRPSILQCNAHYSSQRCVAESERATPHMRNMTARAVCRSARSISKKPKFSFSESRPAHLYSLMHRAPPLHLSSVECCNCCRTFASFATSFMKRRAVVQMTSLRFGRVQGFFRDTHAGHLQRTCGALLGLSCGAFWRTAVQHCEQLFVGQLQSARDGKVRSFARDHNDF